MNHTIICVESLPKEEAWVLFKCVVGERVEIEAKLKPIAMKVAEECGGLPLILQVVGKALKYEENFKEWEKALYNTEKNATLGIDSKANEKNQSFYYVVCSQKTLRLN
ncbi:hypothetical protein CTI12_AA312250 [Artemisia annua]|uniref:Uncharacterized protein n=1 Tax=Artemisia annua TaxID=35608 RepID=A0A2U1N3B0_ARTAN|nr:hypothetical protein CTI12_AA312250 [Artemisia annua]